MPDHPVLPAAQEAVRAGGVHGQLVRSSSVPRQLLGVHCPAIGHEGDADLQCGTTEGGVFKEMYSRKFM